MNTYFRAQRVPFVLFVAALSLFGASALAAEESKTAKATSLLMHSSMNDAQSIFQPDVSTATYGSLGEAVPGSAYVSYEAGQIGNAAKFDGNGYVYTWPVDGLIRFSGENFDFDDPESDGGRLDFWIKFNVDPHASSTNTWIARSNWGERYMNFEFAGSPVYFFVDVFSNVAPNHRTNYQTFRADMNGWAAFDDLQAGEWQQWSILWRRNGGPHKAEIHVFINGTQAGCLSCSDYNGNLPPIDSITDFFFSPQLFDEYMLFSIDEVYSFNSWDVTGIEGNFADLQIPEGVTLKYPQDNRYPIYSSPVPEANIVYEFTVQNDQSETCNCDLYVDGQLVDNMTATDGAHMEFGIQAAIDAGVHAFQVKCDGDRLVSPVHQFDALATTPLEETSMGGFKAGFRR